MVIDTSDIEMLKNSIEREFNSNYSLGNILEDYLVSLNEKSDDKDNLKQKYDLLKPIIEKEHAEKPFAQVPEDERRLLIALREAICSKKDEAIKYNLNELSSVLSVRNRTYERTLKINRWSVPLAIFGLIASLAFGIISIIKAN